MRDGIGSQASTQVAGRVRVQMCHVYSLPISQRPRSGRWADVAFRIPERLDNRRRWRGFSYWFPRKMARGRGPAARGDLERDILPLREAAGARVCMCM